MSISQKKLPDQLTKFADVFPGGLELPEQGNVVTIYSLSYFLLSCPKPSHQLNYHDFVHIGHSALRDSNETAIRECLQSLPLKAPPFRALFNERFASLSLWYSAALEKSDDDIPGFRIIANLMNKLRANFSQLQQTDFRDITIFTPAQLLKSISQALKRAMARIADIANSDFRVPGLNGLGRDLLEVRKVIKAALQESDFLLSGVSTDRLLSIRLKLIDFGLFSPFTIPNAPQLEATSLISVVLYYLDQFLTLRNSSPPPPTSAWDVHGASTDIVGLLRQVLKVDSDPAIGRIRAQLAQVIPIFETIRDGYAAPKAKAETTRRVMKFLLDQEVGFEWVMRQLAQARSPLAPALVLGYYQLITSLRGLSAQPEGYSASLENFAVTLDADADDLSVVLDDLELLEADTPVAAPELLQIALNPTPSARRQTKSLEAPLDREHILTAAGVLSQTIERITAGDSDIVARIARPAKEALRLAFSVDAILDAQRDPEVEACYARLVTGLNTKLGDLIAEVCVPLKKLTPFAALKAAASLLSTIVESLERLQLCRNRDVANASRDEAREIGKIRSDFEGLARTYRESAVVLAVAQTQARLKAVQEFRQRCAKYDQTSRECYFGLITDNLIVVLKHLFKFSQTLQVKQFAKEDYVQDLEGTDQQLRVLMRFLADRPTFAGIHIGLFLSKVQKVVTKVAMARASPATLAVPIIRESRKQLEGLQELLRPVIPAAPILKFLARLSSARWKLSHLGEIYDRDSQLLDILRPVLVNLRVSQRYMKFAKGIQSLCGSLAAGPDPDGYGPESWIKLFSATIHNVLIAFSEADARRLNLAIDGLNRAIEFLGGAPVAREGHNAPEFVLPYLSNYFPGAFANYLVPSEFVEKLKQAVAGQWPATRPRLHDAIDILSAFVASNQVSGETLQSELALGIVWFFPVAKLLSYGDLQSFVDMSIAFHDADPGAPEFPNLCFGLLSHFHRVFDRAARIRQTIKSVKPVLLSALAADDNSRLGDCIYSAGVFASLVPIQYSHIFKNLDGPLRLCYRGNNLKSAVGVAAAVRYLKDDRPRLSVNPVKIAIDSASWRPLMEASNVKSEDTIKRLSGAAGWGRKAFTPNGFVFTFTQREVSRGKQRQLKVTNEFQLPIHDRSLTGRVFQPPAVTAALSAMADYGDGLQFVARDLRTVFFSHFRPRRFTYGALCPLIALEEKACHPVFAALQAAKIGDAVGPIQVAGVPADQLLDSFLPAVCRLLEISSPENVSVMVEFLGSFHKKEVKNLLYSWAFLYFNPLNIGRDLFGRYLSSVADYIMSAIQTGDRRKLDLLLRTLDYLVTFGYCIVLAMAGRASPARVLAVEKRAPVIVKFCSAVSTALGALSGCRQCSLLNSEFVYFLDLVSVCTEPAAFYHIFGLYLSALTSAKPVDLGNVEPSRITGVGAPIKLALTTIRHFALNPTFLTVASQVESQVPGLLTVIFQRAFLVNDTRLVQKCTIVYSELAQCVEAPGADVARLSKLLFPILSCSAAVRNQEALKNDSVASEHFAILILLLVHSVDADCWKQVFSVFNDEQQVLFIASLQTVLENLLVGEGLPRNPAAPIPEYVQSRVQELDYLGGITTSARKSLNATLLHEFTVRTLGFLWILCDSGRFRPGLFRSVIVFFVALLNRYQNGSDSTLVLSVLAKFIDVHFAQLFTAMNGPMGGLVATAIELTTRQLQQAKAAGLAILLHLLFRDYTFIQNIIITGNFIIEQFIEKLWMLPTYKYECLVGLVTSMAHFLGRWADRAFVDRSIAVVNILATICRILQHKSIPYVLQATPQVCRLFRAFPSQLVFWLNAAVKMAMAQGLAQLAFEFQLRVVTVIWLTLYELKEPEVLRFDLRTLTQDAEKIDLSQYTANQLRVVVQAEEISVPGLEAALQGAIQIGEASGMQREAEALKVVFAQSRLSQEQ